MTNETEKKSESETTDFSQNQKQINNSDESDSEQNDFEMNEIISASNFIVDQRQKFINIITTIIKINQRSQNLFDFSSSSYFDFD